MKRKFSGLYIINLKEDRHKASYETKHNFQQDKYKGY